MKALTDCDNLAEALVSAAFAHVDSSNRFTQAGYDETARLLLIGRLRAAVATSLPLVADLYLSESSLEDSSQSTEEIMNDLLCASIRAALDRKADLRRRDIERVLNPLWFQSPKLVGYVAYAEQFGPTIADITKRVDYLSELGVRYFHLMNVLEPRPEPNDGGFAVADYRNVSSALGSIDDLEGLADTLRAHDISLCIDFVMNHTAREHAWAVAARGGDARYRDYYLVFPDRTDPDAYEETLPEVFPEISPGNFTYDEELSAWVWTTFNDYQWDLNYANPNVLVDMFDIMCFLANRGIESLRLDAVAFTWKRKGTNCQNQPEAHTIVQILRALMSAVAPSVILKAEAIVGPRELTTYLGAHSKGFHQSEFAECQIAYHNQLMVNIWSALATSDGVLLSQAMKSLPQTPTGAGWGTYVRCHDDIGWAIDDTDAAAIGINGAAHRRFLAAFYRGDFPGTFAHGASFSVNEETGDERTCGMTSSLTGISYARRANDPVGLDLGIRRLLLAYGIASSFGMPLIYMGDELALADDASYTADPTRANDSRWMQRPQMNWEIADERFVGGTVEYRVFSSLRAMLQVRAKTVPLHQGGQTYVIDTGEPSVFAFAKRHPQHGVILGLANLAEHAVAVTRNAFEWAGLSEDVRNALGDTARVGGGKIIIEPLSLAWFIDAQ